MLGGFELIRGGGIKNKIVENSETRYSAELLDLEHKVLVLGLQRSDLPLVFALDHSGFLFQILEEALASL